MKKGDCVNIAGFYFKVLDDGLGLYMERDEYLLANIGKTSEENDEIFSFLENLVDKGKLEAVGSASPILENQYQVFFVWDEIPTSGDMELLQSTLGDIEWNRLPNRDREMLALGYRLPRFVYDEDEDEDEEARLYPTSQKTETGDDCEFLFKPTVLDDETEDDCEFYLNWIKDQKAGTLEEKLRTVLYYWLEKTRVEHIRSYGVSVAGVGFYGPGEKSLNISYTDGLSKIAGFELLIVNGPEAWAIILAQLAKMAISGSLPSGVFRLEDIVFQYNGNSVGIVIKDLSVRSKTARRAFEDASVPNKIKQIYIADKNNILPGEEGYDLSYVQDV
jgi:hypothetical protein